MVNEKFGLKHLTSNPEIYCKKTGEMLKTFRAHIYLIILSLRINSLISVYDSDKPKITPGFGQAVVAINVRIAEVLFYLKTRLPFIKLS
jgi:hypothetical protein